MTAPHGTAVTLIVDCGGAADHDVIAADLHRLVERAGRRPARVVPDHGDQDRVRAQPGQRRRQSRVGEHEVLGVERGNRELTGEPGHGDLHSDDEAVGQERACVVAGEGGGRQRRRRRALHRDVHVGRGLGLERPRLVDRGGDARARCRQRRAAEQHHAAHAAARERVGVRAGRVAESGDRAGVLLAADLDHLADRVAVVGPGQPVEAPDRVRVRGDVVGAVDVEQAVAAAVQHREAAVLAGDEDPPGELTIRDEPGRELRAAQGDLATVDRLDPPTLEPVEIAGLVAVVDVHEVADQEALAGPAEPDRPGELDTDRDPSWSNT